MKNPVETLTTLIPNDSHQCTWELSSIWKPDFKWNKNLFIIVYEQKTRADLTLPWVLFDKNKKENNKKK